jgi:hypothetical protein
VVERSGMERLTERNPAWIDDELWESACEPDCEEINAVYRKLKDYEGLEEQGRLLKLPCDKVYYIVDKNNPKYATVMSKSIRDLTVYEIENIDIDGRYFSTKELAEAKLKELRGGENESNN